jgi:CubicO group peptidase (beta-lactamase class C family)
MLLNEGHLGGVRILSPKTIELATSSITGDLSPSPVGAGQGFGLGSGVVEDLGQSRGYGSVGVYSWVGAYGTSFWIDPQEQLVAMMLLQMFPGGEGKAAETFRTLAYQAITEPGGRPPGANR